MFRVALDLLEASCLTVFLAGVAILAHAVAALPT